jgi:hypothetical protein
VRHPAYGRHYSRGLAIVETVGKIRFVPPIGARDYGLLDARMLKSRMLERYDGMLREQGVVPSTAEDFDISWLPDEDDCHD